jgi:amino acid transporter
MDIDPTPDRPRGRKSKAQVAAALHPSSGLRRVLTFWPLLFYGLGVIVGAGIYVATGTVIQRAGQAAPFSFLLAGVAAGLTGLCYAELGARFPEAAGGASYVRHGFGSNWLTLITAAATTLAVAVSAASIAHGTIQYLGQVLPLPPQMLLAVLIVGFTVSPLWASAPVSDWQLPWVHSRSADCSSPHWPGGSPPPSFISTA